MKKLKVSSLTGAALDWAIGKCNGFSSNSATAWVLMGGYSPSIKWHQGGPIIERERLDIYTQYPRAGPVVWYGRHKGSIKGVGPTPLIAAMRCYVTSKLGDEIEIPKELV